MVDIKIEAPIKVDLKVIVVDDNGNSGEVTFELPAMQFPTKESIIEAINEVAQSDVLKHNNMRIADKRETFDYIIRERTGVAESFAMPRNSGEWYDETNPRD